ncbi:hypothetical protein SAMN06264364_13831 [Quadrisphaera granulorum]|uniref:Uncharacterized protein n=1 Tax=Quadrisphaera granulorum TaxID=317664 RepID=A0A315ZQK4_9ACTN|nr:hypothetical protein BXY45_13831 [Quadrisphaera granulorum]SZE98830.1 hypothetical protein SAMN06264364_13831 [Quadrisphaera granulorum]
MTLQQLLDDAAFLSLEHQLHLDGLLGDHTWDVDLSEGHFAFRAAETGAGPLLAEAPDGELVATRMHLLGTAAPGPRSWLWCWANPVGFGDVVTGLARWLRDFGGRHGVPELSQPEVQFAELPGAATEPAQAVGVVLDAAKAAARRWTSYSGDVGNGTRAAFLLDHPAFALPEPSGPRTLRVLLERLSGPTLGDHRRAVASYAGGRSLAQHWEAEHAAVRLAGPAFELRVRFDELGQIAGVDADFSPA